MVKKIPVYQAKVTAAKDDGIYAMSFVDFPAVERNFVALKQRQQVKLNLDRRKQILTGVVLVPDQLIYRNQPPLGEYYMRFSAQDIELIAQKMMRQGLALSTTTHQHEKKLDGNYLVECWTVADPKRDKSVAIGLGELPVGTLCASYKITDARYWQKEVVSGNVKGFSLEGFFNLNNVTVMAKQTTTKKPAAKKTAGAAAFFRTIAAMFDGETTAETEDLVDVAADDETDSGTPYLIFELADGGEVYVDAEGFATINDEQAPAGEHALSDGSTIVIGDDGVMVVTTDEPDSAEAIEAELKAAKARGKQYLAAAKKKKPSGLASENAKLKAELAALKKKTPSAPAARARKVETNLNSDSSTVKFTNSIASVLSSRRERGGK